MTGPISPSTEGPNFAPPQLPPGWIAQWDGASKKYYYVQLATGVSQWEIPTEAAKSGSTPAQRDDPYGAPPPELITHPDGSQTVKHADGTMEPIMPDGSRGGPNGPTGDRGLGTMAMNALLGGKNQHGGGGGGGGGGGNLGNLANQFLGGGHSGGKSSGLGGKIVGQLASNLFSPSDKPEAPSNYHGGQTSNSPHHHGGLAGSFMGSVAHMFGGESSSGGNNFGYSGAGTDVTYQGGEAPTYKPPGSNHNIKPTSAAPTPHQSSQSHSNSGHGTPSHSTPSHSQTYSQHPPSGYSASDYSQQSSHGSSQHGNQSYGSSQHSGHDSYSSSQHGSQYNTPPAGGYPGGHGGPGGPGGYPGQGGYGGHGGQQYGGQPHYGGGYPGQGYGQGGRY